MSQLVRGMFQHQKGAANESPWAQFNFYNKAQQNRSDRMAVLLLKPTVSFLRFVGEAGPVRLTGQWGLRFQFFPVQPVNQFGFKNYDSTSAVCFSSPQ
jgi:hypothetical protein